MRELEKILEEIDNLYVDETDFGIECNMENRSNIACDNCYECIKEACKNIIRKHMNDGWIPVEERLPEDDSMVLVTCQTKKGIRSVNRAYCDGAVWHGSGSMSGVIAWRPLPDSYRPERSEGE